MTAILFLLLFSNPQTTFSVPSCGTTAAKDALVCIGPDGYFAQNPGGVADAGLMPAPGGSYLKLDDTNICDEDFCVEKMTPQEYESLNTVKALYEAAKAALDATEQQIVHQHRAVTWQDTATTTLSSFMSCPYYIGTVRGYYVMKDRMACHNLFKSGTMTLTH